MCTCISIGTCACACKRTCGCMDVLMSWYGYTCQVCLCVVIYAGCCSLLQNVVTIACMVQSESQYVSYLIMNWCCLLNSAMGDVRCRMHYEGCGMCTGRYQQRDTIRKTNIRDQECSMHSGHTICNVPNADVNCRKFMRGACISSCFVVRNVGHKTCKMWDVRCCHWRVS